MFKEDMVDASKLELEMDRFLEQTSEVMALVDSKRELVAAGLDLAAVVRGFPMMGFSWKESYIVLRFLSVLNRCRGEIKQYADTEDKKFLCNVIAVGITKEILEFAKLQVEEEKGAFTGGQVD